jgi:hypothetical protein
MGCVVIDAPPTQQVDRMDMGYLPGYELKAAYQRNMLFSMLLTCLISVAVALVVLFAAPSPTGLTSRGQGVKNSILDRPNLTGGSKSPARSAQASLNALNPYARVHKGFLGFRRINPAAQGPSLPNVKLPRPSGLQSAGLVLDSVGSFSAMEGDGGGDGPYVPLTDDYFLPGDSTSSTNLSASLDRDIQVLTRVDPEYPIVALDRRMEGHIAVLVFIGADGRLSTFPDWLEGNRASLRYSFDGIEGTLEYAMTEDPADWFFGANFLKVLPRWQFIPRLENGEPVGSMLIIKYTFSLVERVNNLELVPVQQR